MFGERIQALPKRAPARNVISVIADRIELVRRRDIDPHRHPLVAECLHDIDGNVVDDTAVHVQFVPETTDSELVLPVCTTVTVIGVTVDVH